MSPVRVLSAVAVALVPAFAAAHFPFLHVKRDSGQPVLHVYFAESPEPDDPALLSRLDGAEVRAAVPGGSPQLVELRRGEASLVGTLPDGAGAVVLTKDMGVVTRGGETFALRYYAKAYAGDDRQQSGLTPRLDVVPAVENRDLTLTVTFDGKPLANAEVVVQGGVDQVEGTTDAAGRFSYRVADPDLYGIRVRHVENAAGETNGKAYAAVRHYATLTLDVK